MLDNNPLTGLIEPPDRKDSWRWGTIVSGSPVRVRLDGDSEASLATPDCLVSVTTGDRVRVQISNRRMTVFGKLYAGTQGNPGEIVINGTAYATSGTADVPSFTWSFSESPVHVATVSMPSPFTLPAGWTFTWSVQGATGFTFVTTGDPQPVNGKQQVRILQIANSNTDRITRLVWQLVKL